MGDPAVDLKLLQQVADGQIRYLTTPDFGTYDWYKANPRRPRRVGAEIRRLVGLDLVALPVGREGTCALTDQGRLALKRKAL